MLEELKEQELDQFDKLGNDILELCQKYKPRIAAAALIHILGSYTAAQENPQDRLNECITGLKSMITLVE